MCYVRALIDALVSKGEVRFKKAGAAVSGKDLLMTKINADVISNHLLHSAVLPLHVRPRFPFLELGSLLVTVLFRLLCTKMHIRLQNHK